MVEGFVSWGAKMCGTRSPQSKQGMVAQFFFVVWTPGWRGLWAREVWSVRLAHGRSVARLNTTTKNLDYPSRSRRTVPGLNFLMRIAMRDGFVPFFLSFFSLEILIHPATQPTDRLPVAELKEDTGIQQAGHL